MEGWRQISPSMPFLIKSEVMSSHSIYVGYDIHIIRQESEQSGCFIWLGFTHTLILQLFSVWANVDWLLRCCGSIEAPCRLSLEPALCMMR